MGWMLLSMGLGDIAHKSMKVEANYRISSACLPKVARCEGLLVSWCKRQLCLLWVVACGLLLL